MKRLWFVVVLFLLPGFSYADSGRESTQNPPQEIEMKAGYSSSETWAHRVKDSSGVIRNQIDSDGSFNLYNSSGTKTIGVNTDGKPENSWKDNYLRVDTMAEARGASSSYNVLLVDTAGYAGNTDSVVTGVSVYLPAGSAVLDGFKLRIVNITASGTTDVIIVPANDIWLSSGVTDHLFSVSGTTYASGIAKSSRMVNAYDVADARGEVVEYVYEWVSSMSGGTWWARDQR